MSTKYAGAAHNAATGGAKPPPNAPHQVKVADAANRKYVMHFLQEVASSHLFLLKY